MIVVDCSAVVDASVGLGDDLAEMLTTNTVAAPELLDYEFVSALRGMVRGRIVSESRARDALGDFDLMPIERWSASTPLRARAFELRHSISAYDAAYVALAESLDCPLLTRDRRLQRTAKKLIDVIVV